MKFTDLNLRCKSRTIIDSRGYRTTEVDLIIQDKIFRSSCPAGASIGLRECVPVINYKPKFNHEAVGDAHRLIKSVLFKIVVESDVSPLDSPEIDIMMLSIDSTKKKENVGVNALLPLSLSFCKMSAHLRSLSLYKYISQISQMEPNMPIPHFNVLNGGVHSGNQFAIQEIMVAFECSSINEHIESICQLYYSLRETISEKYGSNFVSVGDEGGFAPPFRDLDEAILLLKTAGQKADKLNFKIAIDAAANNFYENGKYIIDEKSLSTEELCDYYLDVLHRHSQIYSIEDPFHENDVKGWKMFYKKCPSGFNIVGDDLTVTNTKLIRRAGEDQLCNVLLVKPNQIGTVLETINAVKMAKSFGMKIMVSHRSGETEDNFISDFAVGIGADYIKSGAPCRGERVCKYNQLLRINEELNSHTY